MQLSIPGQFGWVCVCSTSLRRNGGGYGRGNRSLFCFVFCFTTPSVLQNCHDSASTAHPYYSVQGRLGLSACQVGETRRAIGSGLLFPAPGLSSFCLSATGNDFIRTTMQPASSLSAGRNPSGIRMTTTGVSPLHPREGGPRPRARLLTSYRPPELADDGRWLAGPSRPRGLHESLRCSREPRSTGRLLASSSDLPWHVVYLVGGLPAR